MSEKSTFALRLPPELKAAARALTSTSFIEPVGDGSGLVNHIALRSINEAILFLMRKGVKAVLHDLEPEIAAARDEHAAWQEVVRFFLANPAADWALPTNFPDDTPARKLADEHVSAFADDEPSGTDDVDALSERAISRRTALEELSISQNVLASRIATKGALQRVYAGR